MIQILITLSDDGQLSVRGPLQNKIMAYGLLEMAKDVVRAQPVKPPDIVVPVRQMPDNGHLTT